MLTAPEMASFQRDGYLLGERMVTGTQLADLREDFDEVMAIERQDQIVLHQTLRHPAFVRFLEHPPILERAQALFGDQTQLLDYALVKQGPGPNEQVKERYWHRDFTVPGDFPLACTVLLYLDDITLDTGPTRVVPGTHRGSELPPEARVFEALPGEVAVLAKAGDALFFNPAVWHSGGRNVSTGQRRIISPYFGFWWLKRYHLQHELPWQAFEGASQQRLRLLGAKMPAGDLHRYDPQNRGRKHL